MNSETIRVLLQEDEMPKEWYNIAADFKTPPLPPVDKDGKPVTAEALSAIFPMNLIEQEVSTERWIPIPDEVRRILYRWRPTPLRRAVNLEKAIGTPARECSGVVAKNSTINCQRALKTSQ